MVEYYIEHERHLSTLQEAINARLADGWTLAGGIATCHDHDQGYMQAIQRKVERSLRQYVDDHYDYNYKAFLAEQSRIRKEQMEHRRAHPMRGAMRAP